MNSDNETIANALKIVGLQVQMLNIVLLATVNGMDAQNKLLADKLPNLTPEDRQTLKDAVSRNESQVESLEASFRQFDTAFEAFLKQIE